MAGDDPGPPRDDAAIAEDWLARAEPLIAADDASDPAARLARARLRLDAIHEGRRLRTALDRIAPEADPRINLVRSALASGLTKLRRTVDERDLAGLLPDAAWTDELIGRLQGELDELRSALRTATADPRGGALEQGLVLIGLRDDVDWAGRVIARVDGDAPPRAAALLIVDLERLERILDVDERDRIDPNLTTLRDRCARLRNALLERRVDHELSRPPSSSRAEPGAYWVRRFNLSKLQAQIQTLGRAAAPGEGKSPTFREKHGCWIDGIARLRDVLADQADAVIDAQTRRARVESRDQVIRIAHDEINETVAFLEHLPPSEAVHRLELAGEDLERLLRSCSSWSGGSMDSDAAEAQARSGLPQGSEKSRSRLRRQRDRVRRLLRQIRREWQEKLLKMRLAAAIGPRPAAALENIVLALIVVLSLLIVSQAALERVRPLTPEETAFYAWSDLAICSVFLFEFFLKLALAPRKGSYLLRHFAIDFLASIPYGFLIHQVESPTPGGVGGTAAAHVLAGLLGYVRFTQLLRFLRVAAPAVRLLRVALFALRLSDRLVRRMAGVLNRNIVLFEPTQTQRPESRLHYRLTALRAELDYADAVVEAKLDVPHRVLLGTRLAVEIDSALHGLPPHAVEESAGDDENREIPVEAVVERLIQMTPERLIDRMGPAFVVSIDRYIRIFDAPILRRLPVIRNLVSHREKSHAEAVALAANYMGHLIQRGLDVVYFLADLQGTVSPAVFLDRLGLTIMNATSKPAKRLLWLGSATSILYLIVLLVPMLALFRPYVAVLQGLLGWPVIILGAVCLGLWRLGAWFRKIANQSADFCERVVEAQFATQTKGWKAKRQDQDGRFLAERVIDPELLLRASDDDLAAGRASSKGSRFTTVDGRSQSAPESPATPWNDLFPNRELAFLKNLRLLYQDYLDGSPLHRSDNKASIQLLGNLALANLRRSSLGHLLHESRMFDRLDLSRSGGLFGGAFLWFNYITRMIVQDTALLLIDYNRHAIPLDRLMCSPESVRQEFRRWLASRLKVDEASIRLPDPVVQDPGPSPRSADPSSSEAGAGHPHSANSDPKRRREAQMFFETVEFMAIDFLADDPDREDEIRRRFGPQVAELVRLDRQQNVRRAFRSFPLHDLPLAQRTFNPLTVYENNLAAGRLVLLPFRLARISARALGAAAGNLRRMIREILHPNIHVERDVSGDTYWAALRKIHRMRKPIFMGSLWLRARFDVEYLGLPLPTAPPGPAAQSLLDADLDVIDATRRDRIIAETIRRGHQKRLEAVARWLDRFGWTFQELPHRLAQEVPFLADRGGEALRALTAACILDYDDVATLGLAIEGLTRMMNHAADRTRDPAALPFGLPEPVADARLLWRPVHRCRRPPSDLFTLPCFPRFNRLQQRRILHYLRRNRRVASGWIKVVLGQGGSDPWLVVKNRLREVLVRTDLWSDQIIVLRAVQTLTMLDLQHSYELVWSLGGYQEIDPAAAPPTEFGGPQHELKSATVWFGS